MAVERPGAHPLLVLSGHIDLDAAAHLRAEAERLAAGCEAMTVDWHAATHVSAGAVQVLVALQAALSARGRTLHVARDNQDVRRFLELAGLSGRFPVLEQSACA